ncbi:hypothetical protein BV898_18099 [Hypsibius exemplaris]|uniref:Uncharacterized protein n=1 Tax=Hypsibius exemplaris TaxID=2072580 RepID=A0A9X6NJF0_HYPEX|nr:hypothetical protein BV898_18099 [Hypsibius exemplaris]
MNVGMDEAGWRNCCFLGNEQFATKEAKNGLICFSRRSYDDVTQKHQILWETTNRSPFRPVVLDEIIKRVRPAEPPPHVSAKLVGLRNGQEASPLQGKFSELGAWGFASQP